MMYENYVSISNVLISLARKVKNFHKFCFSINMENLEILYKIGKKWHKKYTHILVIKMRRKLIQQALLSI